MLVFQLLQNFGACMSLPQSFHASSDQVLKGQKLITITPVIIKINCNDDIELIKCITLQIFRKCQLTTSSVFLVTNISLLTVIIVITF